MKIRVVFTDLMIWLALAGAMILFIYIAGGFNDFVERHDDRDLIAIKAKNLGNLENLDIIGR